MKRYFAPLACVLFLTAACQSGATPDQTATVAVGDTCVVATGLINIAIVFNDKLSAAQKNQVTHAISILRPTCTGPTPTVASAGLAAFRAAEIELVGATSSLKP